MSDSDSLVLLTDESSCDSKLRIIGGKVNEDSGSPLSSLLLALKIILIYLINKYIKNSNHNTIEVHRGPMGLRFSLVFTSVC